VFVLSDSVNYTKDRTCFATLPRI